MSQLDDSEQRNEIIMTRWRDFLEGMTSEDLGNYFPCLWIALDMKSQEEWMGLCKDEKIKRIMDVNYPENNE